MRGDSVHGSPGHVAAQGQPSHEDGQDRGYGEWRAPGHLVYDSQPQDFINQPGDSGDTKATRHQERENDGLLVGQPAGFQAGRFRLEGHWSVFSDGFERFPFEIRRNHAFCSAPLNAVPFDQRGGNTRPAQRISYFTPATRLPSISSNGLAPMPINRRRSSWLLIGLVAITERNFSGWSLWAR